MGVCKPITKLKSLLDFVKAFRENIYKHTAVWKSG